MPEKLPCESLIRVEQLVKDFEGLTAIDSISVDIKKGEKVSLFGPNGAGKSTLLHLLVGLLRPTSGKINIDGQPPGKKVITMKKVGFAGQQGYFYEALTIRQNLDFYGKMYGLSKKYRNGRIAFLLESFNLSMKQESKVNELSKGMKQRLNIVRALLHDPQVMLLDEPYSGLDEASAELVYDILDSLTDKTILMATHDIDRGITPSNRVIVLDQGRIAFDKFWDQGTGAFRQFYRELTKAC